MKTISNLFHFFNFLRQNRYFQNYQQSTLKYQQVDYRQSNDQLMFFRIFRVLRSQNIMMYNFIKHSVDFFIRRFKQIAKIKKNLFNVTCFIFLFKKRCIEITQRFVIVHSIKNK